MKTIKIISMSAIFGLLLMSNTSLFGQDPLKAASNVYKNVLLENDQVRVIQIEFAPGETAAWHQHPNHVIYVLTDGKLEITDKGKPSNVMELKAGSAMYMPAVTHMAKNVGTTTVKLVVTELKSVQKK
jgi:quercetin dioxygenase-like cupin family protein